MRAGAALTWATAAPIGARVALIRAAAAQLRASVALIGARAALTRATAALIGATAAQVRAATAQLRARAAPIGATTALSLGMAALCSGTARAGSCDTANRPGGARISVGTSRSISGIFRDGAGGVVKWVRSAQLQKPGASQARDVEPVGIARIGDDGEEAVGLGRTEG